MIVIWKFFANSAILRN